MERHLEAHGFHVVAVEQKDSVLQVYFYGSQYGTDTVFLCEFVLLFARRFFQATFKCEVRLLLFTVLRSLQLNVDEAMYASRYRIGTRLLTL